MNVFSAELAAVADVVGLGAADHEAAAHELFIVEFDHSAFGFVDARQSHERKTFGFLRFAVADDLGVLDGTDPGEQFGKIALDGVEREVADVDFRRGDFEKFRFAGGFGFGLDFIRGLDGDAVASIAGRRGGAGGTGRGGFAGEEGDDALEKAWLLGWASRR